MTNTLRCPVRPRTFKHIQLQLVVPAARHTFVHVLLAAPTYYQLQLILDFRRYAHALSAAVWRQLFAADPFSSSAGHSYRSQLLARGAEGDPAVMVRAVLGCEPVLSPLMEEMDGVPTTRSSIV